MESPANAENGVRVSADLGGAPAPDQVGSGPTGNRQHWRSWLRESPWQLPVLIVIAGAVIGALTPNYLSATNLRAILESAALTGIVAVTATPVTLSGNFFSLSTQQSSILGAVLFAWMIGHGVNVAVCLAATLLAVAFSGLLQGLLVAAGLNPIITTLAAGSVILGAVAWRTQSQSISMGSHSVSWLGIDQVFGLPASVLVFIGVTLVVSWVSAKTVFGRRTLLVGANRLTAEISGISVRRVTVWVFVVAGIGSAIAGILSASAIGYANTQFFGTLTFDVIAALLIGGTSIQGGYGSPLRSAFGAVLIAMINDAMLLHQYSSGVQQTVEGGLVLLVIVALQSKRLAGRRR
jgi:ribose transport system permease protein